jgi:hypothetical protein
LILILNVARLILDIIVLALIKVRRRLRTVAACSEAGIRRFIFFLRILIGEMRG